MKYCILMLALLFAFCSIPSLCSGTEYDARLLGILPGDSGSGAFDINNSGTILVGSGNSSGLFPALWTETGGLVGISGDNCLLQMSGINNGGYTYGYAIHPSPYYQAGVICSPDGNINEIQANSAIYGLNDSLTAIGSIGQDLYAWYNNGDEVYLDGGSDVAYYDRACINNKGVAAWEKITSSAHSYLPSSYVWNGAGKPIELMPLNSNSYARISDINDLGQIVGYSGDHAIVWDASGSIIRDLGIGMAFGINNFGQVVGEIDNLAVLWETDGSIVYLGGGRTSRAYAINDNGHIVGSLNPSPTEYIHAVLWQPVPEPSSLLALFTGLAGIGGIIWRRRR